MQTDGWPSHAREARPRLVNCLRSLVPDTKIVPVATLRILKCGFRAGDAAPMAYIELVGRPVATEDLDEDYANAQAVPAQEVAQETASETTEAVEESVAAAEEESAAAAEEETATDAEEPKAEEDTTQEDKKDG